jgi:putative ABC transport system substrate-binding protein
MWMNRRSLLVNLLAAVALSPFGARGADASSKVARVGYIDPDKRANALWGWPAFWKRMKELGWVEGQNLVVEARWADGQVDRLPDLVKDVIGRKVDVIFTYQTTGAVAAKNATGTIPIVFAGVPDPVGSGLVSRLARPGSNLTGISSASEEGWSGKWLELLQEVVPNLSAVTVLSSPDDPYSTVRERQLATAAADLGIRVQFILLGRPEELYRAFEQARKQSQAILVQTDAFTMAHRYKILALANKHRMPDMYSLAENVEFGGLISYGVNSPATWRRAAEYVDKILKGAKPEEVPVERASEFILTVNLKRAKALGLTMPESILLRADEVIR